MKRGYYCICYTVHFTIYFKDTIINQQRIRECLFLFHLIQKSIKLSEKYFTLFVIKRILELMLFTCMYKVSTAI